MPPSLISTDTFPGDDMSPEAIGEAASMIRFVGDQVAGDAADVVKTWATIAGSYDAPEAGQLVAAMTQVKTSGDTFDSHLGSAADALVTFADEVRTIKTTLEGLRGRANALLATIDGNGKVGAGGIGPGTDWWHDPVTFGQNEELITAVAAQADLLSAAQSKCAGAIESLVDGGGRHGENGGPGFSTVTAPPVEDAPWGHVMTGQEMDELWEQQAPGWERGASKQVMEGVAGLATIAGFDTSQFDPSSGLPHGTLFGSWSVHNSVTTIEGIASMLFRHPLKTGAGALKGFFAIGDWDHPGYAIGEVAVNVAGVGLAFTKLSSVSKIGTTGRGSAGAGRLASDAAESSRLARLAEIGQRVSRKVTLPTVEGLKNLAQSARLSTTWTETIKRLDKVATVLHHDIEVGKANGRDHVTALGQKAEPQTFAGHDLRHLDDVRTERPSPETYHLAGPGSAAAKPSHLSSSHGGSGVEGTDLGREGSERAGTAVLDGPFDSHPHPLDDASGFRDDSSGRHPPRPPYAGLDNGVDDVDLLGTDPAPSGNLPAGSTHGHSWDTPAGRQAWVDEARADPEHTRNVPGSRPADEYQRSVVGDPEVRLGRIEHERIWADGVGVDPDKVVALEAKYVANPARSIYEGRGPAFMQEKLMEQFDGEMHRYADVIRSGETPVGRLRILTNTPGAAEYLGARARRILGPEIDLQVVVMTGEP